MIKDNNNCHGPDYPHFVCTYIMILFVLDHDSTLVCLPNGFLWIEGKIVVILNAYIDFLISLFTLNIYLNLLKEK